MSTCSEKNVCFKILIDTVYNVTRVRALKTILRSRKMQRISKNMYTDKATNLLIIPFLPQTLRLCCNFLKITSYDNSSELFT